jgi:hypothetical protein
VPPVAQRGFRQSRHLGYCVELHQVVVEGTSPALCTVIGCAPAHRAQSRHPTGADRPRCSPLPEGQRGQAWGHHRKGCQERPVQHGRPGDEARRDDSQSHP